MIADDDPTAQRLREAVWADPSAEAPRSVFADYYLEAGDPLGELVALQLQRSRTGDPISQRELELSVVHGRRTFQPIALGIQRYELERGFLAHAFPIGTLMTREVAQHPAWSTMTRLTLVAGGGHPLLANPHVQSLATLCTHEEVLVELSRGHEPLPVRALTAPGAHRGIAVGESHVEALSHRGAFDRVRRLSLAAWHFERALNARDPVLESRLIAQLEHLDLTFTSVRLDDLRLWRRWAESTALARFSVQVPLGHRDEPGELDESVWSGGPTHFAYVECVGEEVILQLDEATSAAHVDNALAATAELAGGRTRLVIQDLEDANRVDERHAALIAGLRTRFAEVSTAGGPVHRRAP